MVRIARTAAPGYAYHITQRGNNRQDVFFTDDDRAAYLDILKKQSEKYGLEIHGYCLMANHVHLVVIPHKEQSLAKGLGRTHFLYTQYINRLHGRSGHLWQNRFYSCPLDDRRYWAAMRYIELNPVRAGIVRKTWRYQWSSAAAHIGRAEAHEVLEMKKWKDRSMISHWAEKLEAGLTDKEEESIRCAARTGRPLGSDTFISKLETTVGRRLRALPPGRPKKQKKEINKSKKGPVNR